MKWEYRRAFLVVLVAVFFAASIAHADGGEPTPTLTFSQAFTVEALSEHLPVVHFALHNPFYGGELKVYRGFYLADLIRLLTPARDGVAHFEALDGYHTRMEISEILGDQEIVGVLAFEEAGVPGGFEPLHYGRYNLDDLGPFWLVWGHIDPSRVHDGGLALRDARPWPWQLAKIWIER